MQVNCVTQFIFAVAFSITVAAVNAQNVTLEYKGLTLNADFTLAPGKSVADGAILITHGGLAHRDMEFLVYLRKLLKGRGYNTLTINLSLSVDNRHGMVDCALTQRHQNSDAVDEIGIWIEWLKKQGITSVTLLGHSRGGAQTALYLAERDNAMVKSAVLMAPATGDNTSASTYKRRYNKSLTKLLQKAEKLVGEGKGDSVLEHIGLMLCRDTAVTADSFVSYYGQDSRVDTPTLIPKINKPIFILVAGNDKVVVGLDKKVTPFMNNSNVQMSIIEGSDHLFRDLNTDDAVDAIDEFLQGIKD